MKNTTFILLLVLLCGVANAQTKKVLLEHQTGALCGDCADAAATVDNMLAKYPDLIAVSLHSFGAKDAMDFTEIEPLNSTYFGGAPVAAIDRVCHGSSSMFVGRTEVFWENHILQQLADVPQLTIVATPVYDDAKRLLTANVSIEITDNMPTGDYRLSLYVVEDSVTGSGLGYDQANLDNTNPSSPFYGLGNPIPGFIHRHVARALLPGTWGLTGLLPASPTKGQTFSHTFTYTVPSYINAGRLSVIAFVSQFSNNHMGDKVLNATQETAKKIAKPVLPKMVLLEHQTGALCGDCPTPGVTVDNLLAKYPNLVAVSLHSFGAKDAMDFAEIDPFYTTYTTGAPVAAIDRVCHGPASTFVARTEVFWENYINQQLAEDAQLSLSTLPLFNASTRTLTTDVTVDIADDMDSGDYRLNLYVVEDSVTGSGFGYDQANLEDAYSWSSFYGKGNPISGFIHRHVARALLPNTWGLTGLLPVNPANGQQFTHTFTYTVPTGINADHLSVIAFVSRYSSAHMDDKVLNVAQEKARKSTATGINATNRQKVYIYPNPASNVLTIENMGLNSTISIMNCLGQEIISKISYTNTETIDVSGLAAGFYTVKISAGGAVETQKLVLVK